MCQALGLAWLCRKSLQELNYGDCSLVFDSNYSWLSLESLVSFACYSASLKKEWSYLYSCVSTAFFGGLFLFIFILEGCYLDTRICWLYFFNLLELKVGGSDAYRSRISLGMNQPLSQFTKAWWINLYIVYSVCPSQLCFMGGKTLDQVCYKSSLQVSGLCEELFYFYPLDHLIPFSFIIYAIENLQIPLFNITSVFCVG